MPRLIDHGARRRALAAAAWRVIVRDGVSEVSIRTVAAEAGLSAGSLRHVLPTTADLLGAALELVYDSVTARILALPDSLTARDRALAICAELLPLDAARRAEFEVQLSLTALSFSQPALAHLRDTADTTLRGACSLVLALVGARADHAEVERLYALVDGLALHLVYRTDLTPDTALAVVEQHLDSIGTP